MAAVPAVSNRTITMDRSYSETVKAVLQSGSQTAAPPIQNARFTKPTKYRSQKLIVGGYALYVNSAFLGEMSPFFEKLFAYAKEKVPELKEEKASDVQEFLAIIGADMRNGPESITVDNCCTMLRYADMWDMPVLKSDCVHFIENELPQLTVSFEDALQLLLAAEMLEIPAAAMASVTSKVAEFGTDLLNEKKVFKQVKTPSLAAALYSYMGNGGSRQSPKHHGRLYPATMSKCCVDMCDKEFDCNTCSNCHLTFCSAHMRSVSCPTALEKHLRERTEYPPEKRRRIEACESVKLIVPTGSGYVDQIFFEK